MVSLSSLLDCFVVWILWVVKWCKAFILGSGWKGVATQKYMVRTCFNNVVWLLFDLGFVIAGVLVQWPGCLRHSFVLVEVMCLFV